MLTVKTTHDKLWKAFAICACDPPMRQLDVMGLATKYGATEWKPVFDRMKCPKCKERPSTLTVTSYAFGKSTVELELFR